MLKIENSLKKYISPNMMIVGGHYMINQSGEANLNSGTISAFQIAVNLFKYAVHNKINGIKLGLLINDIGTVGCREAHSQKLKGLDKTTYQIPKIYRNILGQEKITINQLHIFWEKHLRNRGSLRFRRHYKNKYKKFIVKENNSYWYYNKNTKKKILLTRNARENTDGLPACPLIMSSFAEEQIKSGIKNSLNIWYINDDNKINIPSHLVLEKGKLLSQFLKIKNHIVNAYIINNELYISN
jgi:hypothetical protein